jgi:hypothetical protein
VRLSNTEPSNLVHDTILKHTPFCRAKRINQGANIGLKSLGHSSLTAATSVPKNNFIYFIDDLNLNYSCSSVRHSMSSSGLMTSDNRASTANLELSRQILETHSMYSNETDYFVSLSDINFLFSCTYPGI